MLKLGLTSADLNLEEQEQLWASHLEKLELQAAMSFLPSATKLCVGHLLLGPTFSQANNEVEAVASTMTGAGDQAGTSEVEANSKENSSVAAPPTLPTSDSTVSIDLLTSAPNAEKNWLEGSFCLARCSEDGIWYRAKVVCQDSVKGDVKVTFVDYSSDAVVGANDIVSSVDELEEEERSLVDKVVLVANAVKKLKQVEVNKAKVIIPVADDVEIATDQNNPNPYCITKVEAALHDDSLLVETSQEQSSLAEAITVDGGQVVAEAENFCLGVSAGQDCVAKWNEDGVWYRAQVAEVGKDGKVLVVFTDYGNSAYVEEGGLVAEVDGIPAGEEKDVNLVEAADAVIDDANLLTEENNIEAADGEIVVEGKYVKLEHPEEARAVEEVEVVEEAKHIVEADIQVLPSRSQLVELKIDDFCVACFSEDNVW